jgi:hypothetical protein
MSNAHDKQESFDSGSDSWEVFEADYELMEPEPERGDFWGELDDDFDNGD